MATILKHKRSSTASSAPAVGDLALGELAVNDRDGKVFLKTNDGVGGEAIREVGTNPSSIEVNGAFSFPTSDGSSVGDEGQILQTNGAGTVSWVTPSSYMETVALTTTTANQVLYSAPATNNSVKITIAGSHSTAGKHICEVLMNSDGTDTFFVQYADVSSAGIIFSLSSDVDAGNMRLLVTPTNTNTTFKMFLVQF